MTRIAKPSKPKKDDLTGEALIAALQASPHRDIDIEPSRAPMPVREISR